VSRANKAQYERSEYGVIAHWSAAIVVRAIHEHSECSAAKRSIKQHDERSEEQRSLRNMSAANMEQGLIQEEPKRDP
jgi:hypothetical protein